MSEWYHNGDPVDTIAIGDRGFQYGDGLFETIAIRSGAPRLWGYHVERLVVGCERLGIDAPDREALRLWLDSALQSANVDRERCVAKIVVTSGESRRGYGRERPSPASTYIGVFPAEPLVRANYQEGVGTIICDTRLAVGSACAGLKTLNRVEQVLARSECLAAGAFEGLTFDADGRLICGTMSNVFLVIKNAVLTPLLSRCGVAGVMRRHVMDCLVAADRKVVERDLDEGSLRSASEIFLSNSQFGVVPVRRCGDHEWPVGPITRDVMNLLAGNDIPECRL